MMATADEYAAWIVKNADKKGTPEFDTVAKAYQASRGDAAAVAAPAADQPGMLSTLGGALGKGFGSTVLGAQKLVGKGLSAVGADSAGKWLQDDANQGQAKLTAELAPYKAANPTTAAIGETGGEIIATLPVGGLLGKGVIKAAPLLARAGASAPAVEGVANALATSGFKAGPLTGAGNMLARTVGGGVTGGASAAMVNPDDALVGAGIGAALPGVIGMAGKAGGAIRSALTNGGVAPEVAALATRAKQLGIDTPADRIANSKPLNALAASLNYVPLSGRAATESGMQSQLNRALSRTFGQDTDNVTMGLRKAREDLGGEFDRVLQANTVRVDEPFLKALSQAETRAGAELESGQASIIKKQIDEILAKAGGTGEIDGQAAYNVKKTLDRIGKRNSPEAFYANDLKRDLMEALNRSMAPADAEAFAQTRKQYGNMLSLDKLAQNGVDGDVSIARIANMKNIGNKDLQELADISAQFLKAREGQHGAAQRTGIGGVMAVLGGPAGLATGVAAGRATNSVLNSNALKQALINGPSAASPAANRLLQGVYRTAPVAGSR